MSDSSPLSDGEKVAIWGHYTESRSMRATAKLVKRSLSTVQRVLAADAHRLATLRTAWAEDRAAKWRDLETGSLDAAISAKKHLGELMKIKRNKWDDAHIAKMRALAQTTGALRLAADTASKEVQLLTGGATERIGSESDRREDMTDAQLYEALVAQGWDVPPGMQQRYKAPAKPPAPPAPPAKKKTAKKKRITKKKATPKKRTTTKKKGITWTQQTRRP